MKQKMALKSESAKSSMYRIRKDITEILTYSPKRQQIRNHKYAQGHSLDMLRNLHTPGNQMQGYTLKYSGNDRMI